MSRNGGPLAGVGELAEHVNINRLTAWMDSHSLNVGCAIEDVHLLGGGTQNILVRFSRGTDRYVLRRPPNPKRANSDLLIQREARVLRALDATPVPHPRVVAGCDDNAVLGCAFYLMEVVDGTVITAGLPGRYGTDESWMFDVGLSVVDGAATIGAVDYVAIGLEDFGRPGDYISRQVTRWYSQLESYADYDGYRGADLPELDLVTTWLDDNTPTTSAPGLMHGDYHLANVMCAWDRPQVCAIVDWELATIGDPLIDLGWVLATWPDADGSHLAFLGPDALRGLPSRAEMVRRYAEHSTRDLSSLLWYEVFACYKLAIIVEATYARAHAGLASRTTGEQLHGVAVQLLRRAHQRISRPPRG
jgi:aminoglycoside phosphotransferase (APT) family kinase protein